MDRKCTNVNGKKRQWPQTSMAKRGTPLLDGSAQKKEQTKKPARRLLAHVIVVIKVVLMAQASRYSNWGCAHQGPERNQPHTGSGNGCIQFLILDHLRDLHIAGKAQCESRFFFGTPFLYPLLDPGIGEQCVGVSLCLGTEYCTIRLQGDRHRRVHTVSD